MGTEAMQKVILWGIMIHAMVFACAIEGRDDLGAADFAAASEQAEVFWGCPMWSATRALLADLHAGEQIAQQ